MIDRSTPTKRPAGPNVGTQSWQSLDLGHWRVSADWLQSQLPVGLQIEPFEGSAYLGLVPFQLKNTKPRWLPQRLVRNFLESNLWTYCLLNRRPGVYFFPLDANSRLAVWFARWGWSLPYHHSPMQHRLGGISITSLSQRTAGLFLSRPGEGDSGPAIPFRPDRELGPSAAGTLAHFLLERYLLFTRHKSKTLVGQVHHPAHSVYTTELDPFRHPLNDAAGLGNGSRLPVLFHFSPCVDVEIFPVRPSANKTRLSPC